MRAKILIIDDETNICAVLGDYLRDRGFEVDEANDLSTARKKLADGNLPDLILTDVMLGDGNGILFTREVRQTPKTKDIPLIIMSAQYTRPHDKVAGLELGADDYVPKPFDLREMLLRIENILKRRSAHHFEPSAEVVTSIRSLIQKKEGPSTLELRPKPKPVSELKPPAAPRRELWKDFKNLILDPRSIFSEAEFASNTNLGNLCVVAAGGLIGLQQGVAQKSIGVGFVYFVVTPLLFSAALLIVAGAVQWLAGFQQKNLKLKSLFNALAMASGPLVIAGFLGFIYVLAGGQVGDFTAGPLLFFPSQESAKYLGLLLRRMDLFEIWSVSLVALGLQRAVGGSSQKIRRWTFGIWFTVVVLISVASELLT